MDVMEFKKHIGFEEESEMEEKGNETGTELQVVELLKDSVDASTGEVTYSEYESKKNINKEKVNIIVAGKTGVGKSSLINYIFGKEVAKVGDGQPVTQEIQEYDFENDNITLFDTKGIEAKDYEKTLDNIKKYLELRQDSPDENDDIHIAWLCISERGDRVEEADRELLKILSEAGIPVIGVFTKRESKRESNFVNKVVEDNLLPEAKAIVRVRSITEEVEIEDNLVELKPKGAEELLEETYKYMSEGRRNAIKKAQTAVLKDRIEAMSKEADVLTNWYAAGAAAIGATPLPFADSLALAALQTKMVVDINTIYRVDAGTHTFTDIAAALITITGVAQVGKLAAGLLKVIPVIGWTANAGVAAGITKGIGFGYSEYLKNNINKETGEIKLDLEDLKQNFMKFFNQFKDMI
ncbi:MAG: 50S ribosome-binding GTPase [Leptotrichia sp.]|nr:50S ribosome-binding GTPase [Leptotrichia sp.]